MLAAELNRRLVVADSILDLIGRTPVLELKRICQKLSLDGRLLAKLEHLNPAAVRRIAWRSR